MLSASGQFVDARSAEGISTVFGCVQALSESTATLPLHLYARLDNGDRQRADDYPLARVLRQPTEILTGFCEKLENELTRINKRIIRNGEISISIFEEKF